MHPVKINGRKFEQDGLPVRILAGAMHYFRVMPAYWRDRLIKLKAMGLNTVETYVCWNLHEPRPGRFDFSGQLDLPAYIRLAEELGLMVIVRPGPYICSEWDFGGFPAWLLKDPSMRLRCAYPPYLKAVDRYFDALIPRLTPLLASRDGPIVAMQIENEYGSYGNDQTYLRHLRAGLVRRGVDCLLFTSDGPTDARLTGGTLPDV
ncbi:MAG: beta-galactosidase, partial [Kiritimatiellia bacterium]